MIIGIDFDNTIILYDTLVYDVACKLGFIPPTISREKTAIRDFIRSSPAGDEGWQRVQGQIYGRAIRGATLAEGFKEFAQTARRKKCSLSIISHKTELGHFDETKVNLRDAARGWMDEQGFFKELDQKGLGFSKEEVFFHGTREGKIEKIRELGCNVFIDDLPEVFEETSFPPSTKRVLYAPLSRDNDRRGMEVCTSWYEIIEKVLNV